MLCKQQRYRTERMEGTALAGSLVRSLPCRPAAHITTDGENPAALPRAGPALQTQHTAVFLQSQTTTSTNSHCPALEGRKINEYLAAQASSMGCFSSVGEGTRLHPGTGRAEH